jgi:MPBQ/MSBQ methyltransferase
MGDQHDAAIAAHYGVVGLEERICAGLRAAGIDPANVRPVDLAPVDEFHMGGRTATANVLGSMGLSRDAHVLDIGSGLGGVARYLASEVGCRATGIDLTPEYVYLARQLTTMTSLDARVAFEVGSALALPGPDGHFDAAVTFHVAMNITDRPTLYAEAFRVLSPGAPFASYDVLKGPADGMLFPTRWAATAETNHLVAPAEMVALLQQAGFEIIHQEDHREVAIEHHRARLRNAASLADRPPLGLHLLQGEDGAQASRNMIAMLEAGQITLQTVLARRPPAPPLRA